MLRDGDDVVDGEVAHVLYEYGVVHLKSALNEEEQERLLELIPTSVGGTKGKKTAAVENFHLSSGPVGSKHRCEELHEFSNMLYTRAAQEVGK
eukprot:622391-Ditylum_brightwellii.AAC.1